MKILTSILILTGAMANNVCSPTTLQNSNIVSEADTPQAYMPRPQSSPEKVEFKNGKVEFKGVSFTYDPRIFSGVRCEEVLEDSPVNTESDKPGENFPKHIVFYLKSHGREATIHVIPIIEYRRMFAISENLTRFFDERLDGIRRASIDEKFRIDQQMPFIPFYDAGQEFQNKVRRFSFQNGKGFFFLTAWAIEPTIIDNEELEYFFQGTTSEESKYVLADFPVSVQFLPNNDSEKQFEVYGIPNAFHNSKWVEKDYREYEIYISKIARRLEKLPENKFQPDLKYYQEIISSLKIRN